MEKQSISYYNSATIKIEIMANYVENKRNEFLRIANQIKELGYRVFVYNNYLSNFGWVTDGTNIGSFFQGDFGYGVRFCTVHKPCKEFGTGFSITDWYDAITNVKDEDVKSSFNHHPSSFDNDKKLSCIRKYKNWDEFSSKLWCKSNIVEL